MFNSWWVGNKLWRNFMKSTPEEAPLKHLWIDLFFLEQKSAEGHKETNLGLNHMIQRRFLHFSETFPAKICKPARRGRILLYVEVSRPNIQTTMPNCVRRRQPAVYCKKSRPAFSPTANWIFCLKKKAPGRWNCATSQSAESVTCPVVK